MPFDPTQDYGEVHAHKRIKFLQDGFYYDINGVKVQEQANKPGAKGNVPFRATNKVSAHSIAVQRILNRGKKQATPASPNADRPLQSMSSMDGTSDQKGTLKENARAEAAENLV